MGQYVRAKRPLLSPRVAGVLAAVFVALLAFIVLWPSSVVASETVWRVWSALQELGAPAWVTQRKIEFGMNVVLFMPLSFLGSAFRPQWGWGRWLLTGLFVATGIEVCQLVLLPDRSASVLDIVANTLGTVAGYAVVTVTRSARRFRAG